MELSELRKQIVLMAHRAGGGHIPSALSILPSLKVLYDNLNSSDRIVLSKGHGSLALYVILAEKGLITQEQLDSFGNHDSILGGHPDRNKVPGVICSTGSLGHGFPQAVGIALAKTIKHESGLVYCFVGDGECNEGSIWESALIAAHHKLSNLTVVVDYNHSGDRAVDMGDISKKFRAFGFNGPSGPSAVILHTTKGEGCKRMSDPSWHHRAPTDEELKEILEELSCADNS